MTISIGSFGIFVMAFISFIFRMDFIEYCKKKKK